MYPSIDSTSQIEVIKNQNNKKSAHKLLFLFEKISERLIGGIHRLHPYGAAVRLGVYECAEAPLVHVEHIRHLCERNTFDAQKTQ